MKRLDRELYLILNALPPLPFAKLLRPTAASVRQAKRLFLTKGTLPHFEYTAAKTFVERRGARLASTLAEAERKIEATSAPKLLKQLYLDKLTELQHRLAIVEAIATGDDKSVSHLSLVMYGDPSKDLKAFEQEFSDRLERTRRGEVHYHEKRIDTDAFRSALETALAHYGFVKCDIKLSQRARFQCSHKPKSGAVVLRIPNNLTFTLNRARRLIAHEIEVHLLRRANGSKSKLHLLERGFAQYHKTEEGLALYHQHLLDTLPRQHMPGFWDAWASALMFKLGFKGCFDRLKSAQLELFQARQIANAEKLATTKAWDLCLRASRGITQPGNSGIGFFKDHLYRDGYLEVRNAIQTQGAEHVLPLLFAGKVGLTDLPKLIELGIEPGQLPDDISKKILTK